MATHSITASYSGDTTYAPSNNSSSPVSEIVSQVGTSATSMTVTASPTSSVSGQPVTFTATVTGTTGSGTPTGTITFTNGSTTLGTGSLNSSGVATFSTSSTSTLPVGNETITATYNGDATYASKSQTVTETVDQVGTSVTSTAVTALPTTTLSGQSVTFTATVTSTTGSATPTGSVTFTNGSTTLGTETLTSGVATFSTSTLPVGSDTITASYSGDTTYAPSTNTATETVNQASSLAGHIYFDSTDSGTYSSTDLGLGNAMVQLFIQGSDGTWTEVTPQSPTVTDSSGAYSFSALAAGTYQIRETTPAYYLDGNDNGTGESPTGTMTQGAGKPTSGKFSLDRTRPARDTTSR